METSSIYHQYLYKYHEIINEKSGAKLTKELLVERIKSAPTIEKGVEILEIFNNYNSRYRFNELNQDQMVNSIMHNQIILDYFKIDYPLPSRSISHLFQPKTPNEEKHEDKKDESRRMKWSTGPNGFNKTNVETILQNIPKRPTQLTDLATGIRDIPKE